MSAATLNVKAQLCSLLTANTFAYDLEHKSVCVYVLYIYILYNVNFYLGGHVSVWPANSGGCLQHVQTGARVTTASFCVI